MSKRLKMWLKGFESEKYYLYDLESNDYQNYLSDYDHQKTKYLNYPYDLVLHNKILFEQIVSQHIRVPKNYAFIENGTIFPLQNDIEVNSVGSMIDLIREKGCVVIKPVRGSQGRNIVLVKMVNGQLFMDSHKTSREEFGEYLAECDSFLVTEFIHQDQYARDLYPHSTNTIRILMLRDPDTKEPFVAAAAQRIGSKASGSLDNFTLGGYSANVDLESGILSAAITKQDTLKQKKPIWHHNHGDTGAPIKGVQIPQWQEIKEQLTTVMQALPYFKCVGWDVVLSEGQVVVIEGNSYPQFGVLQSHRPLLLNPRVRRFYEHHNVIKEEEAQLIHSPEVPLTP